MWNKSVTITSLKCQIFGISEYLLIRRFFERFASCLNGIYPFGYPNLTLRQQSEPLTLIRSAICGATLDLKWFEKTKQNRTKQTKNKKKKNKSKNKQKTNKKQTNKKPKQNKNQNKPKQTQKQKQKQKQKTKTKNKTKQNKTKNKTKKKQFCIKNLKIVCSSDHTILFKFHQCVWYKYLLKNVWRDFRLSMTSLETVTRKTLKGKFTEKIDFPIGYFMLPSLMSHALFDKYLNHTLVKFEQNCIVWTIQNIELFVK